jgi:hypothetical protein
VQTLLAFPYGGHDTSFAAAAAAISAWMEPGEAWAANGAYAVDAADISEVGSCEVESWLSTATNTDFAAVANPSCAVNIFRSFISTASFH